MAAESGVSLQEVELSGEASHIGILTLVNTRQRDRDHSESYSHVSSLGKEDLPHVSGTYPVKPLVSGTTAQLGSSGAIWH